MSRWLGLEVDPTAGGTNYDLMASGGSPVKIAKPKLWVPVTTAQVDPNLQTRDRNDENRGRRGNTAPMSFASEPRMTFGARAYPKILRPLISHLLGGTITNEGTGEKAKTGKVTPLQSGSLPAFMTQLLREEQLDRLTGAIVANLALNFPIDQEGSFTTTLEALYHDAQGVGSTPKEPDGTTETPEWPFTPTTEGFENAFMLRDAWAKRGASETEIPGLAGFSFTFDNGMITDMASKFKPAANIKSVTIDEILHKVWYPAHHKIGAQQVSGTINLSNLETTMEARRLAAHAEKLIFNVVGGPAGTTPAASESMRLVLSKYALTGGGPDPLVREGDQRASFEFTGYLDPATSTDVEAQFVGKENLT